MEANKVSEIRRYLNKFYLDTACQYFWKKEPVEKMVKSVYLTFSNKLKSLAENVPEEKMTKKAEEQRRKYLELEDEKAFSRDFLFNFEKEIYNFLQNAEIIFDDDSVNNVALVIRNTIEAASSETIYKVEKLGYAFSAFLAEMFITELYANYIPEDMPKEVAETIMQFTGGPIIPAAAIFPELKDMDD